MFVLAVYGRVGAYQARVSVADETRAALPLVARVNDELVALPLAGVPADARAAAWRVLRRLGFGEPDAGGWFEGPIRP